LLLKLPTPVNGKQPVFPRQEITGIILINIFTDWEIILQLFTVA
jgi:hypothetical protein